MGSPFGSPLSRLSHAAFGVPVISRFGANRSYSELIGVIRSTILPIRKAHRGPPVEKFVALLPLLDHHLLLTRTAKSPQRKINPERFCIVKIENLAEMDGTQGAT